MKPRHLLIPLLLASHVLVGLVLWSLPYSTGNRLLLVITAVCQVCLLAIWLVLGRRAAPWRLVVLVAAVVTWSWAMNLEPGQQWHWIYLLLPQAATIAVSLLLARIKGLHLYQIDSELNDGTSEGSGSDRPWQFSLGQLFAWTTSLAICLSLLSITLQHSPIFRASEWGFVASITIVITIVALSCLLSLSDLRAGAIVGRLAILLFLSSLVLAFAPAIGPGRMMFFLLLIPAITASLLVCRVAGYRLGWKRKHS